MSNGLASEAEVTARNAVAETTSVKLTKLEIELLHSALKDQEKRCIAEGPNWVAKTVNNDLRTKLHDAHWEGVFKFDPVRHTD